MSHTRRIVFFAALLGLGAAAVTFLGAAKLGGGESPEKGPEPTPVKGSGTEVTNGTVCLGTVDREVRPFGLFPKNFPQPSEVSKLLVSEGKEVRAGESLLELNIVPDKTLADLTVEEAQAGVRAAETQLDQAQKALDAHKLGIEAQDLIVQAKKDEIEARTHDLEALRKLVEQRIGRTKDELAAAEKGLAGLRKAADAEEKKLGALQVMRPTAKVEEAKAGLDRAKALLKKAQHALQPLVMTAPSDGYILRSNVGVGTSFGPQTREPAFLFQPKSPLIVRAEVEQEFAHRVEPGQSAIVRDYANSNVQWKGKIVRVADAFLPKRTAGPNELALAPVPDSAVLECIVLVELQEGSHPLRVGQRVRVHLGSK